MNKQDCKPNVYGYPSAPPIETAGIGRHVHPFEILAEPTAEAYLLAEAASDPNNAHNQMGGKSVILRAGKEESKLLDYKIAQGNIDGAKLVNQDRVYAVHSNNKGIMEHKQLERAIKASNADYVHELGVSLADVERERAMLAMTNGNMTANPTAPTLPKGTYAEPLQHPAPTTGGYQFSDYQSMYEVGGGYKSEDYKSIYES